MPRKRLGEILIEAGVITPQQLSQGLYEQRRWGGTLGSLLVKQGIVTESILVRALAKQLNLPVVTLKGISIPTQVLETISKELAMRYNIIPFRIQGKFLDFALSDPLNTSIVDELRIRTQLNVRPHLAPASEIKEAVLDGYHAGMAPNAIDINFDVPVSNVLVSPSKAPIQDIRDAEVVSLQQRLQNLEQLVERDEKVIRKILTLLIEKNVASREEVLAWIQEENV